jgi:hypothetical protein
MRIRFFRGRRGLKDVDRKTDYLLDNGACIQIGTRNTYKGQMKGFHSVFAWPFPKPKFKRLLLGGLYRKAKRE